MCFGPLRTFAAAWTAHVAPALAEDAAWDVLVIGYFAERGVRQMAAERGWVHADTFYGAHAYIVTRAGAEALRAAALPANEQVDGLFLSLRDVGRLRLRLLGQSVVSQCIDKLDRIGAWHTHTTTTHTFIFYHYWVASAVGWCRTHAPTVVLLLILGAILLGPTAAAFRR